MLSLFTTQTAEAGFRLHAFEVLNGGAYDGGRILHKSEPRGGRRAK